MARNRARGGHAALLILIMIIAGSIFAMVCFTREAARQDDIIRAEAKVTPILTPTVHGVSVSRDPALITPEPTATPFANIGSGSSGETVKEIQQILKDLGFYTGEVDGQFGSGTQAAVRSFQAQHGLGNDGVVGPLTWEMLHSQEVHTMKTVDTLAGEWPFLVNKSHPVDQSFVPAGLVDLKDVFNEDYITLNTQSLKAVGEAAQALKEMLNAAHAQGIYPWKIRESYRTWQDQKRIMQNRITEYENEGRTHAQAVSAAKAYVAEPGTSEHHTGLAFDLNVEGADFADTAQYAWMVTHCWEYGFILRYPDDKDDITGFLGEEWHYRYVGREHSMRMKETGQCLEEYLAANGQ